MAPISTPHSPWPSIYVEGWSWKWWPHTLHVSWLEGCLEPLWQRWTCLISVSLKYPSQTLVYVHRAELWLNCQQAMTSRENFAKAHGAAFALLQPDDGIGGALFGEVAMTCLVTMVVLLGAVNAKTRSPLVPFMVGCTVIINILAGWVNNREEKNCESTDEKFYSKVHLFWKRGICSNILHMYDLIECRGAVMVFVQVTDFKISPLICIFIAIFHMFML